MKQGKRTKTWLKTRAEWIRVNKPDHTGHYLCAICKLPVHYSVMTLHHVWGRKGDLLVDFEHLVPTHGSCNNEVGSRRGVRSVSSAEYELRRDMEL